MSSSDTNINEFVTKIHQFLTLQTETNTQLSEAAKESLTVASECIEQAYGIQKKPGSDELFNIYKSHKQHQQSPDEGQAATNPLAALGGAFGMNGAQVMQMLSSLMSQANAGFGAGAPGANATTATTNTGATTTSAPAPAPAPKKERKNASPADKMAAESFKNLGNEFMKQDDYKEAYNRYTQAINLDNNNAIYYSNRAAASSKLGDHQAALRDCQEAVEIDPNYSKAYGRMALAYASLDDHQKAKDAYVKAVELDPNNESYRNNLRIAEERLAQTGQDAGGSTQNVQNNMLSMLRSMISNPDIMQMAMRGLQDPRVQGLFNMAGQTGHQDGNSNGQGPNN